MPQSSNLVTATQKRFRCRHIHAAGHQCGSPALRNEQFCYFHHTTRRPKPPAGKFRHLDATEPFELPLVEDMPSALSVAAQLLCRIASNDLDPQRAGKLLYNLQIITGIIDKAAQAAAKAAPTAKPEPVEELVADEAHGLIAPISEYIPAPPGEAPSQPAGESIGSQSKSASHHASTTRTILPPLPERDYTPEENDYFKQTVSAWGYEPSDQYPRPASITDEDILARTCERRRAFCLPPLKAREDATGRLLSFHQDPASHPIPAVVPQPAKASPGAPR